jgi:hypothetical protein
MANIAQAEIDRVIDILTANPDGLRLFQVAKELRLPHDHNYWQTYSILEWLISNDRVTFERRHLTDVKGGKSKRQYRFFLLPHVQAEIQAGNSIVRVRRRRLILDRLAGLIFRAFPKLAGA